MKTHNPTPLPDVAPIMLRTAPELRANGHLRMRNEFAQQELTHLAEFKDDGLVVTGDGEYVSMTLPASHITVKLARR